MMNNRRPDWNAMGPQLAETLQQVLEHAEAAKDVLGRDPMWHMTLQYARHLLKICPPSTGTAEEQDT